MYFNSSVMQKMKKKIRITLEDLPDQRIHHW